MSRLIAPVRARRTQGERTRVTRQALLDATLGSLAERGYAATTTTEIARAAGLSQGALFKHFASKSVLLSAAIEHLFEQLVADYDRRFAALPQGAGRASAAFDLLWEVFTSPRLAVAFELYMVARTDAELAGQLQPVVRRHRAELLLHARRLFPEAAADNPAFDGLVDLMMCSMEGIVIEQFGAGPVGQAALSHLKSVAMAALARAE